MNALLKIAALIGRNLLAFVTISLFIVLIAFLPQAVLIQPGVQDSWSFHAAAYKAEVISYISGLVQGDLGTIPYRYIWMETQPEGLLSVVKMLVARSVRTLLPSVLLGVGVGVLFAAITAFLPRWAKRALNTANQVLFSVPDLLIIFVLQYLAVQLDKAVGSPLIQVVEITNRPALVLPILCVATPIAAYIYRYTVQACREAAGQEYVRTARAKGLPNHLVFFKHILRPALDSILAVTPKMVAVAASSLVIVERLFNIRGITTLFLGNPGDTFIARMMTTVLIVLAAVVFFTNIATSLLRLWINPALRK
jgi:ABC-type dipeptide/oligopeptide/nickel transport system permease component